MDELNQNVERLLWIWSLLCLSVTVVGLFIWWIGRYRDK